MCQTVGASTISLLIISIVIIRASTTRAAEDTTKDVKEFNQGEEGESEVDAENTADASKKGG